jgi:hypothetical protein
MLVMFADQFVYKKVSFADCYFFLMFGIAGFFYYTYRRGLRKMKENEASKTNDLKKKGNRKN